ncbi:MAG: protein phosphatase 2C domain-containing protein [Gammaproteobacteria bacterium]|nr:protein phosphatase 2C domain-containing protein [Gammaproteobacteria bacterium]MDH3465220.1 protein phosphatase 2C domain-containing protein [Gammaproteobacteria bacterium]
MNRGNLLVWQSASSTHVGRVREINQDACLDLPELGLWAVADGMGGHEAGEEASKTIVQQLSHVLPTTNLDEFVQSTIVELNNANRRLRQASAENYQHQIVGSTVAVLLGFADQCACLWVGDSRIYRLRQGCFTAITHDHTLMQEFLDSGIDSSEYSDTSSAADTLTRAVGAEDELGVDIRIENMQQGDAFLLCSDGLYKEVSEDEMANIIAAGKPESIVADLQELALQREGRDNITLVAVQLAEA